MGNISYKPLIEDMVWSYSRIETFNDCPYRFFLKYIKGYNESDKFYATYGSFMHKLLERFYKNEITKREMLQIFLTDFQKEVRGIKPVEKTVQKYIREGCEYLRGFTPLPLNVVDIEKQCKFTIGKYNFVGFIDFVGEKDGQLYIVDNKSRVLKPHSGKNSPTAKDIELDHMLKQLYLYSVSIEQERGILPKELWFNCFRAGVIIKENFDIKKYEETKKWAEECIEKILNTDEFNANQHFFSCTYICGVNDHCEYDIEAREERRL